MSNTLESRVEDVGTALIAWFASRVTSLGLVSFDWHDHMRSEPSYPCQPRTLCPRAYLRLTQTGHTLGNLIGCDSSALVYQCSIWVQLRQTPGQQHQRLLAAALDVFQTALIQAEFDLSGLAVTDLIELKAEPSQGVVFNELDHPLGDPDLRVSSGEINLTLVGRLG